MDEINVRCSQLVLMRSSANGFANSFDYILKAVLSQKNEDSTLLIFDCDLKPAIVSYAFFAIELYLKLIYAVAFYNEKGNKDGRTKFYRTHDLKVLFDCIPQNCKEELRNTLEENEIDFDKLSTYLEDHKKDFINWRYSFTAREDLSVYASDLKAIINVLSEFSINCINKLDFGEDWAKDIKTTSIGIAEY